MSKESEFIILTKLERRRWNEMSLTCGQVFPMLTDDALVTLTYM
jgi:hypothetical protein